MAIADIRMAVRFKPDTFKSSLESITQGAPAQPAQGNDPATPDTRAIVRVIQLVAFDSTNFNAQNPYRPGSEATERHVYVIDQKVVSLPLSSFAGKTVAQGIALWVPVRDAAYLDWEPNRIALLAGVGGSLLVDYRIYPV